MKLWASKRQTGFTIVELLIVVVVIAILAAITIVAYNGIQNRAKISSIQAALTQASQKVQEYAVYNGDSYPADQTSFDGLGIASKGVTYQYSGNNNVTPHAYCITATMQGTSYYQNNTTAATPTLGACPGHGANGTVPITNLAKNPTGAGGTTGWETASGMSGPLVITNGGPEGQAAVYGTRSGTGSLYAGYGSNGSVQYVPVQGGEVYTSSIYVRPTTAAASTTIGILVRFYDASGTQVDTNTAANYTSVTSNTWVRLNRTDTVPATAVKARVLAIGQTSTFADGDTMRVSKVMVTKGSTLYTYADGASPGWAWGSGGAFNDISSGPAL
jgi:prepilin-type N-terminal cleavage/methylation domain-containing protein